MNIYVAKIDPYFSLIFSAFNFTECSLGKYLELFFLQWRETVLL